jgi:hypothetical protein
MKLFWTMISSLALCSAQYSCGELKTLWDEEIEGASCCASVMSTAQNRGPYTGRWSRGALSDNKDVSSDSSSFIAGDEVARALFLGGFDASWERGGTTTINMKIWDLTEECNTDYKQEVQNDLAAIYGFYQQTYEPTAWQTAGINDCGGSSKDMSGAAAPVTKLRDIHTLGYQVVLSQKCQILDLPFFNLHTPNATHWFQSKITYVVDGALEAGIHDVFATSAGGETAKDAMLPPQFFPITNPKLVSNTGGGHDQNTAALDATDQISRIILNTDTNPPGTCDFTLKKVYVNNIVYNFVPAPATPSVCEETFVGTLANDGQSSGIFGCNDATTLPSTDNLGNAAVRSWCCDGDLGQCIVDDGTGNRVWKFMRGSDSPGAGTPFTGNVVAQDSTDSSKTLSLNNGIAHYVFEYEFDFYATDTAGDGSKIDTVCGKPGNTDRSSNFIELLADTDGVKLVEYNGGYGILATFGALDAVHHLKATQTISDSGNALYPTETWTYEVNGNTVTHTANAYNLNIWRQGKGFAWEQCTNLKFQPRHPNYIDDPEAIEKGLTPLRARGFVFDNVKVRAWDDRAPTVVDEKCYDFE